MRFGPSRWIAVNHTELTNMNPVRTPLLCLCAPEIFAHIPAQTPCDLPRDIFPKLIATGRLFGFPLSGWRCAIDSPARLAEAAAALAQGRCRIAVEP